MERFYRREIRRMIKELTDERYLRYVYNFLIVVLEDKKEDK